MHEEIIEPWILSRCKKKTGHIVAALLVIELIAWCSRIWSSKWHSLVENQACYSMIWPSTNDTIKCYSNLPNKKG